jgi:hypothetical protein
MAEDKANDKNVLLNDAPGDENRVSAVLADWGMDEPAMRRVMEAHRENVRIQDKPASAPYRRVSPPAAGTVSYASDKARGL